MGNSCSNKNHLTHQNQLENHNLVFIKANGNYDFIERIVNNENDNKDTIKPLDNISKDSSKFIDAIKNCSISKIEEANNCGNNESISSDSIILANENIKEKSQQHSIIEGVNNDSNSCFYQNDMMNIIEAKEEEKREYEKDLELAVNKDMQISEQFIDYNSINNNNNQEKKFNRKISKKISLIENNDVKLNIKQPKLTGKDNLFRFFKQKPFKHHSQRIREVKKVQNGNVKNERHSQNGLNKTQRTRMNDNFSSSSEDNTFSIQNTRTAIPLKSKHSFEPHSFNYLNEIRETDSFFSKATEFQHKLSTLIHKEKEYKDKKNTFENCQIQREEICIIGNKESYIPNYKKEYNLLKVFSEQSISIIGSPVYNKEKAIIDSDNNYNSKENEIQTSSGNNNNNNHIGNSEKISVNETNRRFEFSKSSPEKNIQLTIERKKAIRAKNFVRKIKKHVHPNGIIKFTKKADLPDHLFKGINFYSELMKINDITNRILYTKRFCILTQYEFKCYKNLEDFIILKNPIVEIAYVNIMQCCLISLENFKIQKEKYYFFYIKFLKTNNRRTISLSQDFNTNTIKDKSPRITHMNEDTEFFASKNIATAKAWVKRINELKNGFCD